jgi:hypothetical protein
LNDPLPPQKNSLAKKAMKNIHDAAKGNGIKKGGIKMIRNNSELITCEAITHIELHHEINEEIKKGQHPIGEALESPEAIAQKIETTAKDALKSQQVRKDLANILLERPDQGFSLHAEHFDVPGLTREYSAPKPCQTCQGQGQNACQTCDGQKMEQCSQCHGRTTINCSFCHGSGFMQGPDGQQKQCNSCFGQRAIKCPLCQSRGHISCRKCKGSGIDKCNPCGGGGVFTSVVKVFFKAKTLFEMDRTTLPHPAVKMIEDHGTKLVTASHIKVEGKQVKREDGGLAIQYDFKFPYADINIGVNGMPIKVHMFGYKGKMLKINNFLDQLVEKEYALLLRAANNEGAVISHIRKASQSRFIGQGLILAVTQQPKKAMTNLKKKFPFGASNSLIKDVIIQSNKALRNVSRKSHYSGLGIGLAGIALINIIYFIGPLRSILSDILGTGNILNIVDFALIPLGGLIAMMTSKVMAASPLKKALGPLMPENQRSTFKPRNNNSSVPAFIGSAVIMFLVLIVAKFMGMNVPNWFPF